MKLFQNLFSLPALATIVIFVVTSNTALADQRHRNGNPRFSNERHYFSGRDQNYNYGSQSSYQSSYQQRFGNQRNNSLYNRFYSSSSHRHNNWSVSLNLGNSFSSPWYSNTYNTYNRGYRNELGFGFSPFNSHLFTGHSFNNYIHNTHTTVVHHQPSVVYVNTATPVRSHVITSTSARQSSLLRDINGACYERSYDSNGIEIRRQLADSACYF